MSGWVRFLSSELVQINTGCACGPIASCGSPPWVSTGCGDDRFEVGDALVGGLELAFRADDADGGDQRHVHVEQFAHPRRQGELGARE